MIIQTLILGKRKFVVVPEKDFRRLQEKAEEKSGQENAEDKRDARILRKRLSDMRQRREKPVPYAQARKEMGLG